MKCRCPKCGFEFINHGGDIIIINILREKGKINIQELSKQSRLARPSVYYHLMNLKSRGLIRMYKADRINGKLLKGNPTFIELIKQKIKLRETTAESMLRFIRENTTNFKRKREQEVNK
jgi:DNA-binding transcriptional ArsR family regulator